MVRVRQTFVRIFVVACLLASSLLAFYIYMTDYSTYLSDWKVFVPRYWISTKTIKFGDGDVIPYHIYTNMTNASEARLISGQCIESSTENSILVESSDNNNFTLVTDFLFFQHRKKQNLFLGNGGNLTDEVIMARDMEIIHTLVHNLHHPFIEEIHILVEDVTTAEYLLHLLIPQSDRIVIKVVKDNVTMKQKFEYANRCLKNRLVAVAHQDIVFGRGWERIRPDILKRKKLMYAITRHTSENVTCSASKGAANCDPGYPYLGSHDVFFYHVKEQWTSETMKPLESITPNLSGMENFLIWFFKVKLGYKVLNPCRTLYVHHQHCIPVREKGRRRVNSAKTTGRASFTYKLN